VLVGKIQRKRSLGRCRHRYGNMIKMNLKAVGYESVNWLEVVGDGTQ
jgi:hypothetical protein